VQTGVAALLVFPFALAGKDPVLTLFSWLSGLAVLAIMLLYLLTSVSVIVYFRNERSGDTRLWNTLIAPALGAGGIAGAIWLIIANFTTLIGGDTTTAVWLALAVPGALLAGMAMPMLSHPPSRR
jgi:amino acid transporter